MLPLIKSALLKAVSILILLAFLFDFSGLSDALVPQPSLSQARYCAMAAECSCCSASWCQNKQDTMCSPAKTPTTSVSLLSAWCGGRGKSGASMAGSVQRDLSSDAAFPEAPARFASAAEWSENTNTSRHLRIDTLFRPPRTSSHS